MRKWALVAMSLLAGVAAGVLGTKTFNSAQAQSRPPSYVVIDITDMTDPEGFKAVTSSPAAGPARLTALGGRYVIRTETITPLDGTPPKRFVVLQFDSKEKAQGWANAADIKEINGIRTRTTKSSAFIVEGFAN
jgi:uncharacterized protein (DUF1330 family)